MIDFNFKTNVVLPEWIFTRAQDKDHLKQLVIEYIRKHYPDYRIKRVVDGMAECTKR